MHTFMHLQILARTATTSGGNIKIILEKNSKLKSNGNGNGIHK